MYLPIFEIKHLHLLSIFPVSALLTDLLIQVIHYNPLIYNLGPSNVENIL